MYVILFSTFILWLTVSLWLRRMVHLTGLLSQSVEQQRKAKKQKWNTNGIEFVLVKSSGVKLGEKDENYESNRKKSW